VEAVCAPFYSTKPEGMGMGLAICRSIIELHYGVLDVEESLGGGATFAFSLPTEAHARAADNAQDAHEAQA
jgi:two-component system sensor histidine kinase DctS